MSTNLALAMSGLNKQYALKMETFHLFHLASVWRSAVPTQRIAHKEDIVPSTDLPVAPIKIEGIAPNLSRADDREVSATHPQEARIRAAAAQIIFAHRSSK